jgi:hypothetical protein
MIYDDVRRPRSQAIPFSFHPVWLTNVVKTKVADLRSGGRTNKTMNTTKKKEDMQDQGELLDHREHSEASDVGSVT